jgi:glycosyltransferase involved in cell wall biosynthesis
MTRDTMSERPRNDRRAAFAHAGVEIRRTMLMVDYTVPEPDRDAGSRCLFELIRSLQMQGWAVKFWPDNLRHDPVYTVKLEQIGVEAFYRPRVSAFDDWLAINRDGLDAVFLCRPTVAIDYLASLQRLAPTLPLIFFGVDLHSARMRMQSRLTNDQALLRDAAEMEAIERKIWREVDVAVYLSEEEAAQVRALDPSVRALSIVPYCFDDFQPLRPPPNSRSIVFVAGFSHPPNVDGAMWLVDDIMPLVRRAIPDARLRIVGSNPTVAVRSLATPSVEVMGYVAADELARLYSEARLAVVPLRFGAGVKLKVVEALHEGVPLVTTAVGAQGLPGLGGAAVVSDSAEAIAAAIIALMRDDAKWLEQSQRQLRYAETHFTRGASVASIAATVDEAFANVERRTAETAAQPRRAALSRVRGVFRSFLQRLSPGARRF